MSKYQNSIIYKIYDNTNGNVYYGSTYNLLRVRMQQHKSDALNDKRCVSKQIILNGNYSYSMVEPYPCNSRQELRTRERYWIENFDCVNKNVPGRTSKEWRQDNHEHCKTKYTQWKQNNQERYKEYNREYQNANKEYFKRYFVEYQAKNKEEISKKRSSKTVCECGTEISKRNIAAHRKTPKHVTLLALICLPCPPCPQSEPVSSV